MTTTSISTTCCNSPIPLDLGKMSLATPLKKKMATPMPLDLWTTSLNTPPMQATKTSSEQEAAQEIFELLKYKDENLVSSSEKGKENVPSATRTAPPRPQPTKPPSIKEQRKVKYSKGPIGREDSHKKRDQLVLEAIQSVGRDLAGRRKLKHNTVPLNLAGSRYAQPGSGSHRS